MNYEKAAGEMQKYALTLEKVVNNYVPVHEAGVRSEAFRALGFFRGVSIMLSGMKDTAQVPQRRDSLYPMAASSTQSPLPG